MTTKLASQIVVGDNVSVDTGIGPVAGKVVAVTPTGNTIMIKIKTSVSSVELVFQPNNELTIKEPQAALYVATHHHGESAAAHMFLVKGASPGDNDAKLAKLLNCDLDTHKDCKLIAAPVVSHFFTDLEDVRDGKGNPLPIYS